MPALGTEAELLFELRLTLDDAVMVAEGSALIVTVFEPVAWQPPGVASMTPSVTLPDAPAVKAIWRVPAPDVIVPLVTVQE